MWKWFYNSSSGKLYQRFGNSWRIWVRQSYRGQLGRFPLYKLFGNGINLPRNSARATIQLCPGNKIKLTGWTEDAPTLQHNPTHPCAHYSGWVNDNTTGDPVAYSHIANDIRSGQAKIVSDGSFEKRVNLGTAGWIIEDSSQIYQVTGKVSCPGDPTVQCSHRSELIGILGGIMHVNDICRRFNVTTGTIEMGCDGEGAVKAAKVRFETIKTSRKHFDIIASINTAIKASPISWSFYHIDGHQDDEMNYCDLPRPAQLNCIADRLAKDKLSYDIRNIPADGNLLYLPFESEMVNWQNRFGQSVRISSKLKDSLRSLIGRETVRQHWRKKKKYPPRLENQIDWELLHRAHRNFPSPMRTWLSKWLTGFCGIGTTLFLYKFQHHTRCPRCNRTNETVEHVIQCTHDSAQTLWKTEIDAIKQWMLNNEFPLEMATAIHDSLLSWQSNSSYYIPHLDNTGVRAAMHEQDKIGWKSFMDGFQSRKWRATLAAHLEFIRSQRSALLLLSKLMKKLWLLSHMMWKHRNNILHKEGSSIHQYDLIKLNEAITAEFERGLGALPRREYIHLFVGNIDTRLNDSYHSKRMWIASVWTARQKFGEGHTRLSHPEVSMVYENWRKRIILPPSDDEEEP